MNFFFPFSFQPSMNFAKSSVILDSLFKPDSKPTKVWWVGTKAGVSSPGNVVNISLAFPLKRLNISINGGNSVYGGIEYPMRVPSVLILLLIDGKLKS